MCNSGCNGGYVNVALEYVKSNGVVPESCVPYTSAQGGEVANCPNNCTVKPFHSVSPYHIQGYRYVSGEENIMTELVKNGSLSVSFTVYTDFTYYVGGVYKHVLGREEGGHAVKLIGYGVDAASGAKYWLLQNSWGPAWGEGGYFRMIRGEDNCGIEQDVWAAYVETPPPAAVPCATNGENGTVVSVPTTSTRMCPQVNYDSCMLFSPSDQDETVRGNIAMLRSQGAAPLCLAAARAYLCASSFPRALVNASDLTQAASVLPPCMRTCRAYAQQCRGSGVYCENLPDQPGIDCTAHDPVPVDPPVVCPTAGGCAVTAAVPMTICAGMLPYARTCISSPADAERQVNATLNHFAALTTMGNKWCKMAMKQFACARGYPRCGPDNALMDVCESTCMDAFTLCNSSSGPSYCNYEPGSWELGSNCTGFPAVQPPPPAHTTLPPPAQTPTPSLFLQRVPVWLMLVAAAGCCVVAFLGSCICMCCCCRGKSDPNEIESAQSLLRRRGLDTDRAFKKSNNSSAFRHV